MDEPNSPEYIRMACSLCRRRKLKCNRQTPKCDSCIKLQQECVYGVVKLKKSTRKDRTKTLEGRLAQIEKLLRIQDRNNPGSDGGSQPSPASQSQNEQNEQNEESAAEVEEDTIRELENIYFEKIHPSLPMLHRERYMQSTHLEPAHQPPIFLRHAIWAVAASVSPDHSNLEAPLCYSARKYLEDAELRDAHLDAIGVTHVQTWILIAALESRNIHIHRFWMSTGRAVRMAQLMGLFRIDKAEQDRHFDHLAEPRDWVEREEWRRTFWMAFCLDRYGSMGTGWPMGIDDRDMIHTLLPCDEEAFQSSRQTKNLSLMEGMTPQGSSALSPFSALIVITALASRKMMDVKTIEISDLQQSRDAIGAFARRSSWLDSTLSTIFIPYHLRMPSATKDPLVVFLNMICHSITIKVIQMAMRKAGDWLSAERVVEGNQKMLKAATAITNCMKSQSIMDLSIIHPFTSFCLYVAATVFADSFSTTRSCLHIHSLSFLITSMNSLKEVNPMVNAFLCDIYNDFPKIPEWLDCAAAISNARVEHGVNGHGVDVHGVDIHGINGHEHTEAEAETETSPGCPGLWDANGKEKVDFYQELSKEKHPAEIVGMGDTDMGIDDFNFEELGGMGIVDGVTGVGDGIQFLNGANAGIGWDFPPHPQ